MLFNILLDTPSLDHINVLNASLTNLTKVQCEHPSIFAAPSIIELPPEDSTAADTSTTHVHYNKEQRDRANQVFELQRLLHYLSDDSLAADLTSGKIPHPYNHLTAGDVKVNRAIPNSCPHTEAGKHRHHPMPSSLTAPATRVGQKLSFDLEPLPLQHDGYTVEIKMVDEYSGHLSVLGAKSKRAQDLLLAITHQIKIDYTAYGHKVSTLHGDDEIVNASLRPLLGADPHNISVVLSLPGDHAPRIERYTLTLRGRSIATLSPLPYILPTKYILLLHQAVAATLNNSINSRSSPYVPNELVTFRKLIRVHPQFGSTYMVSVSDPKRQAMANNYLTRKNLMPLAELGVCMGPCPKTQHTLFLLANGEVLSRHVSKQTHAMTIPFLWTSKAKIDLIVEPPPLTDADLSAMLPTTIVHSPPLQLTLYTHMSCHQQLLYMHQRHHHRTSCLLLSHPLQQPQSILY